METTLLHRYDFHIHAGHVGCANATMQVPAIVEECQRLGVTDLAITDHMDRPEQLPAHMAIREEIARLEPDINVFFGAECNFLSPEGRFFLDPEQMQEHGFQFVIGGIHDLYMDGQHDIGKLIAIQHRHHLLTCENPMVEVLVHPYWMARDWFTARGWPFIDSLKVIPQAYVEELAQASVETGTAIEINATGILAHKNYAHLRAEYVDYLAALAEDGVTFSVGSDAHDITHLANIGVAWEVAEGIGLSEDRVWHPRCKPLAGPDS